MVRAYIGIGANLGDRRRTLDDAVDRLDRSADVRVTSRSRWIETKPVGGPEQPDFLNGVIEIETGLEPRALLNRLQEIETEFGRVREERWGPRTLDLDLLLYGEETIDEPDLQVPHPRMHERDFVMGPLAEIRKESAR